MTLIFRDIKEQFMNASPEDNILDSMVSWSHKIKTNGKTINIKFGRLYVNLLLPDDFRLIDEPVDKKKSNEIISELVKNYDGSVVSSIVNRLNNELFFVSTIHSSSFDISSFILPPPLAKRRDEAVKAYNKTGDQPALQALIDDIADDLLDFFEDQSEGFSEIIKSGAKVTKQNIIVFLLYKGETTNINGEIKPAITTCLNDGFNLDEYFQSADQARLGYFIRSSGTAIPGDLARQIAFSNAGVVLSKDIDDCGTTEYIKMTVTKKLFEVLRGRFYKAGSKLRIIANGDEDKIIGKSIQLRSPIKCKDPNGVCMTCYGKLATTLSTHYIGILTSSILNETTVGTYMGARHKTSLVDSQPVDFTTDLM